MENDLTSIDIINNKIQEYSRYMEEITGAICGYITPPISSFIVTETIFEPIRRVRSKRYLDRRYIDHGLDEDQLRDLALFFNSKYAPLEEKNEISNKLSNEYKELIYKKFLEIYSKKIKSGIYTAKHNNIPFDDCPFSDVQKMLLGIEPINNKWDLIVLKPFIDSCDYFKIEGLPVNARRCKELVSRPDFIVEFNKYFEDQDIYKLNQIKATYVKHSYEINNQIKEYIFSSMPPGLDTLEQSIYIYAKLCRILDYDVSYYMDQNSDAFLDEERIQDVDLSNNSVVCYTFSYILAGLLREIGIEDIREGSIVNNKFRNSHQYIEYIVDDISIEADSTHKGAETGDLTSLKVENRINELRCSQYNLDKQTKVNNAKRKVESILEQEIAKEKHHLPTTDEVRKMNDIEKYTLFNNIVATTALTGISLLGYLLMLKERLNFDKNIEISLIKDDDNTILYALIKINPFGFEKEYKKHNIEYQVNLNTKEITYNSANYAMKM